VGNEALKIELAELETETFEIDDVADVGENMASGTTSCSTSTSSTTSSSTSTSSTCGCSCSCCSSSSSSS
jgi:thiazolylpeptide-type bacteriocin precursor